MSELFSKPVCLGEGLMEKLDIANYATKANLKSATGVNTAKFAKKLI